MHLKAQNDPTSKIGNFEHETRQIFTTALQKSIHFGIVIIMTMFSKETRKFKIFTWLCRGVNQSEKISHGLGNFSKKSKNCELNRKSKNRKKE